MQVMHVTKQDGAIHIIGDKTHAHVEQPFYIIFGLGYESTRALAKSLKLFGTLADSSYDFGVTRFAWVAQGLRKVICAKVDYVNPFLVGNFLHVGQPD